MNKILIGLLSFTLCLMIVSAIPVGTIITQEQLDNINTDTFDLECQLEDIGQSHLINYGEDLFYYRIVSCLTLDIFDEDSYIVIRDKHYPHFLVQDYLDCRQENTIQQCNNQFVDRLISQHQSEKQDIRNYLESLQTETTDGIDDFDDLFNP